MSRTIEPTPAPLFCFASTRGGATLDQGAGGGNPFASALVELLDREELTVSALRAGLTRLTERNSSGLQRPDLRDLAGLRRWRIRPKPATESRVALVLVFSDYSRSGGLQSLPGAEHDARRVTDALRRAGFHADANVDPPRHALRQVLDAFAHRSAAADVAVLYTTGHGVDVAGTAYLLPGDYPIGERDAALHALAVRLQDMGAALRAKRANLVFYGACRNNPFAEA